MKKAKEPVRVRTKQLLNGNQSVYLDIYINGRRSYKFLKLYLIPERTKADREINKQTMQLANSIKSKYILEIQSKRHGFVSERTDVRFFDYCDECVRKLGSKNDLLTACVAQMRTYEKRHSITFAEIDRRWVKGFLDYLSTCGSRRGERLTQNTRAVYAARLRALLNCAVRDEIISENPMRALKLPSRQESTRMYLTIEELRTLADTPCSRDCVRSMFLFSCLTGLRWSDVVALRWEQVQEQNGFTRIVFKQQKTGGLEYIDINQQAAELMGERGDGCVFGLPCSRYEFTKELNRWVHAAGIDKHITFHCARHTFAVMMIDLDNDLYLVSKLLGHRNIATTQIYAKILDKNKQRAVASIPKILD